MSQSVAKCPIYMDVHISFFDESERGGQLWKTFPYSRLYCNKVRVQNESCRRRNVQASIHAYDKDRVLGAMSRTVRPSERKRADGARVEGISRVGDFHHRCH
jgi:hypothetical protein